MSAALGVLVVSIAYTAGRLGYASSAWADRAYWLGQGLILVPVGIRLLGRRRCEEKSTVGVILVLTIAEYLVKICYSPAAFTFADELLQWRSTVNAVQTGRLSSPNYGLPISPHYPGLQELTSAIVSLTGLSIFTSGLIAIGMAHLVFVCLLYLLYRIASRSRRIAGFAVLVYFGSPDVTSFASMYVYEALALSFLALGVLAAWRAAARRPAAERARWLSIAVLAILAAVVTHHVTSYMLAGTLVLSTGAAAIAGKRKSVKWLGALAACAVVAIVCWIAFAAPETVSYLRGAVVSPLRGFDALLAGHGTHAPSTSTSPLSNQALEGLAVLAISLLLPIGWWEVWRHHRHHAWVLTMAIGSLSWYAAVLVRLTSSYGQELAGRTATFAYIPIGLTVALAVVRLRRLSFFRRRQRATAAVVTAGVLAVVFNGFVNGWPPYWERLPGAHQVGGFERSVGPQEIAAATWALAQLGPGNRFAADLGIYPVMSSYGYQNPLRNIGYLYTSPKYTAADQQRARAEQVGYILVDLRLSQSLPVSGNYFPGGTSGSGHTRPLPLADLTKFNHLRGFARIYDAGDIVIYRMPGG